MYACDVIKTNSKMLMAYNNNNNTLFQKQYSL